MENAIQNLIPEVVFMYGKAWKKTPGYVNVFISFDGEIGLLNSKSLLITPRSFEWKSTKGTYKYVKVFNDEFVPVTKAIHQLVCLTYHGEPPMDGKVYEPNHKDGNKHNNNPNNLEWITRSRNIQHAFDSGFCISGLRIEALNNITKEIQRYNSLNSMSKIWNIPRHLLRDIIARHRDDPYLGIWTFVMDDKSDKKVSRYQRNDIKFKDYLTGNVYIVADSTEASMKTGVKAATIKSRVNGKIKNTDVLLSRYIFRDPNDIRPWPDFSKEEAEQAEISYKESNSKVRFSRK